MSRPTTPVELASSRFNAAPFMNHLGASVLSATADGEVVAQLDLQPWMLQATGVCHAGIVTALGDHTAACAVRVASESEETLLSIELKTNLLRPSAGETLVARATPVKIGRTISVGHCEIHARSSSGDERLTATVTVTLFMGNG